MKLARRHIRTALLAKIAANHAIDMSACIEVTPLPDDWYEIAVEQDRAIVLPQPDGVNCINPKK